MRASTVDDYELAPPNASCHAGGDVRVIKTKPLSTSGDRASLPDQTACVQVRAMSMGSRWHHKTSMEESHRAICRSDPRLGTNASAFVAEHGGA